MLEASDIPFILTQLPLPVLRQGSAFPAQLRFRGPQRGLLAILERLPVNRPLAVSYGRCWRWLGLLPHLSHPTRAIARCVCHSIAAVL